MTTTDTLIARLRQCEAIRDLALERARRRYHAEARETHGEAHFPWPMPDREERVVTEIDLILAPSDPYAMAGLRAVCERADGRWEGWRSTESPGPDAYWSRLEHGPVEALLAEAVEVLCG